ncbi:glycosyltransferase [Streptomyces benahoarensis]|uniref:Glycosyltransferase family 1 protein n=1 Tax=Streptomyces benahoarensis TaxID=2595054 RepID=A0A553YWF4_9ACTN|nr:glycosyltransferase [Streptomyces benahoarensis]TSB16071.1 glycosyltransferase family 1 protein [Streptomyces benahoarensis]TSB33509.1 glycosyltransferase family 1 protein [Streptomyces benahoarensis]
MKILITAAGSYGDVAPYTGIGAALIAAGHDVAIATHDTFAPLVRAAGPEFRRLPADPHARRPGGAGPGTGRGGQRALMRTAAAFIDELGAGMADAVAPGTELLLLSTTTAPLGRHLCEAHDIPALDLSLQPTAPTREFAPVVSGGRNLGRWGNLLAGRLTPRIVDRLHADATRALRARLGLPPATPGAVRRRTEAARPRVLHGFSEVLLPRPADWRPGLDVVGNWWPWHAPDAQLPPDLEDFLADGPPPVFIGFGSMASGGGERLGALAVRALRRAKVRGILQSGNAGLTSPDAEPVSYSDAPTHTGTYSEPGAATSTGSGSGAPLTGLSPTPVKGITEPLTGTRTGPAPTAGPRTHTTHTTSDVLTIGEVPHALLFPRTAAVVHHAGAGTSAAALRAGVPSVPVPVTADQPFWAGRLATLGAATPPIPFADLSDDESADRLTAALIRATTEPTHRTLANGAARRMEAEDGIAVVVSAVARLAD